MLSVIIPARNEVYLERTIRNILDNAEGDIEVLVILDQWLPEPQIDMKDDRVIFYHFPEGIGQRGGVNYGAKMAKYEYIMKLDAHCAVDKGFDVKLAKDCEYDWTVIPRMYNLNHETWEPKWHKRTDYMYIDGDFRARYYNRKQPKNDKMIDDTMCCMGPGFFMHKQRFFDLGGMDEGHGQWGQMGVELACKAWLSGGYLKVNKNTWFAHWFRGGGGPGFPYPISGKSVEKAREYSRDLWFNNKWNKQKCQFAWLKEKFDPPGWDTIRELKDAHKGKNCYIVGAGLSIQDLKKEDFNAGDPLIVLNMALIPIEKLGLDNPIYSMQKDGRYKRHDIPCTHPKCQEVCGDMVRPQKATLLVATRHSNNCYPDYSPRYVFDTVELFNGKNKFGHDEFSANCAIKIAQLFGCTSITFVGFDCMKDGNMLGFYGDRILDHSDRYGRQNKRMHELIEKEGICAKF